MGDHTLSDQRFLYRGYQWDDTLKMYHVRHRVYDPARMLWIQRDPLGRLPGSNEYAYCLGEPVDLFDPMGLWGEQTATEMVNSEWAAERALGWAIGVAGGAAEQLASTAESIATASPESIAEGIVNTVEQGINREDKYAEHGAYDPTLVDYVLTVAAEFVGASEAAAGIAGVDVIEDRLITDDWERFERAGTGLAQMVETGAGAAAGAVGGIRSLGTTATRTAAAAESVAEGASKVSPCKLRRPYIRKWVREEVERRAPRAPDGRPLDPNTWKPIDGKPDLGHKFDNEFWRERAKAEADGLTQKEFNERMNNPDMYQLEDPATNRSHKYEKPK